MKEWSVSFLENPRSVQSTKSFSIEDMDHFLDSFVYRVNLQCRCGRGGGALLVWRVDGPLSLLRVRSTQDSFATFGGFTPWAMGWVLATAQAISLSVWLRDLNEGLVPFTGRTFGSLDIVLSTAVMGIQAYLDRSMLPVTWIRPSLSLRLR